MKKSILYPVSVILLLSLMLLTSCSLLKPSGTYKSVETIGSAVGESYTFSDKNTVEVSALGLNVKGTYKITGDQITITYSVLGSEVSNTYSFDMEGSTIYIDGREFVKE